MIYYVPFSCFGRLAQLVRALPSHGRGHWSESSIAHPPKTIKSAEKADFSFIYRFLGKGLTITRFYPALHHAKGGPKGGPELLGFSRFFFARRKIFFRPGPLAAAPGPPRARKGVRLGRLCFLPTHTPLGGVGPKNKNGRRGRRPLRRGAGVWYNSVVFELRR